MVPGHEIVGIVEAVGKDVTKLKKGDIGAVGCFVDSCRSCQQCHLNEEQVRCNKWDEQENGGMRIANTFFVTMIIDNTNTRMCHIILVRCFRYY